jgi:predicted ATPase
MLGREFSYQQLSAVAGLDVEQFQGLLSDLLDAEMLFQKGVPPRSSYEFKHALIQDAAYQSLLRKDRVANHCRIANLLIQRFPNLVESQPEIVARHFARGDLPASAAPYYLSAGVVALQKSAAQEAADSVARGLEQVEKLPEGTERDRLELGFRMSQGPAFMATVGFSDPRTREIYERALGLSTALEDADSLIPILFGLWIHHGARGELRHTLELADQIRGIAEQVQDPDLLLESYVVVGCATFHMGDLSTCTENFQAILQNYRLENHAQHAYMFGQDPLAAGAAYLGSALWCQGQVGRAFEVGEQAIAQAREIRHPYSLALALVFVARIYQMNRDPAAVVRLAGEAVQVAAEFGFPTWQGFGLILQGWAQAQLGQVEPGLATIEQGLSLCNMIQLGVSRAYFLSMGAEVKLLCGDIEGALSWLEQAQSEIEVHGVQLEQPETCRIRALLECERGNNDEASRCIEEGIRLARENGAPAWEIRCLCEKLDMQLGATEAAALERLQQLVAQVPQSREWPDLARARAILERG